MWFFLLDASEIGKSGDEFIGYSCVATYADVLAVGTPLLFIIDM